MSEPQTLDDPWPMTADSPRPPLFSLEGIDLASRRLDRAAIERVNPHRGVMSLLDWVVWMSGDHSRGIGLKHIPTTGPWDTTGGSHYPDALLLEAGTQMACFLYNWRVARPQDAALLRIENAHIVGRAHAGEDLFILCADARFGRRRFVADVQGLVNGRMVFDARITGIGV